MWPLMPITKCWCCGSSRLQFSRVLWPALIEAWQLTKTEVDYIDRQQGLHCEDCGSNLRSMAIAYAIMRCYSYEGLFRDFVRNRKVRRLRILEVNSAGNLTRFLQNIPGHLLVTYPEVDMMQMPFATNMFDLVVHSDTLEHVADPVLALSECRRVLKLGGFCVYTVPIIVERLTRSRKGLPPSYHGVPDQNRPDFLVHTEYGADAWTHLVLAGFSECRLFALEYPAAQALVGVKHW